MGANDLSYGTESSSHTPCRSCARAAGDPEDEGTALRFGWPARLYNGLITNAGPGAGPHPDPPPPPHPRAFSLSSAPRPPEARGSRAAPPRAGAQAGTSALRPRGLWAPRGPRVRRGLWRGRVRSSQKARSRPGILAGTASISSPASERASGRAARSRGGGGQSAPCGPCCALWLRSPCSAPRAPTVSGARTGGDPERRTGRNRWRREGQGNSQMEREMEREGEMVRENGERTIGKGREIKADG